MSMLIPGQNQLAEPALITVEAFEELLAEFKTFVDAATKAVNAAFGQVPIIASQSSGASDSMWYRALGVPSYGASGTFMRESDDFSHGLDERVPLANVGRSLAYYRLLLTELSSK